MPVLVNPRKWNIQALLDELRADGLLGATANIRTAKDRDGNSYTWKGIHGDHETVLSALVREAGFIPYASPANGGTIDPDKGREKITGRQREIVYANVRGQRVEVIKNPIRSDIRQMSAEVREEFPRLPKEEAIRYRYQGPDVYCWKAHQALHSDLGQSVPFSVWFDMMKSR